MAEKTIRWRNNSYSLFGESFTIRYWWLVFVFTIPLSDIRHASLLHSLPATTFPLGVQDRVTVYILTVLDLKIHFRGLKIYNSVKKNFLCTFVLLNRHSVYTGYPKFRSSYTVSYLIVSRVWNFMNFKRIYFNMNSGFWIIETLMIVVKTVNHLKWHRRTKTSQKKIPIFSQHVKIYTKNFYKV